MPTIRPYSSQESPYGGGIQTKASAAAFGAGVGAELEQLGGAIIRAGPALQAAQDKQGQDIVAHSISTYDPSMKMYDSRTNSTDPVQTAKDTQNWMFTDIESHIAKDPWLSAHPRDAAKVRRSLQGRFPGISASQSAWAKDAVDTQGQLLLDDGLSTLQNRMYTTPNDYDQIVSDSDQQIDRMTDVPLLERDKIKLTQRRDLAAKRFEALTVDATTTEGLDALEAELKSSTWGERMDPKDIDVAMRGINSARTSLYSQFRTEAQAVISGFDGRNTNADVIPMQEIQDGWAKVRRANDPAMAHRMGALTVQQNELRMTRKLAKVDLDGLDYEQAPHSNPDDSNFLMPLLAPGHASNSITGLQAPFAHKLRTMIEAAPPEVRAGLGVLSGYRSIEHQRELRTAAVKKYGSEKAASKWVAAPGHSNHNFGIATDLAWKGGYLSDAPKEVQDWIHSHAAEYGLKFPMDYEPWHIEDADAGSGKATAGNLTMDKLIPAMQQVESGFNPGAISPKGAAGIMQVMPDTAREIAAEIGDQNFPTGGDSDIQKYLSDPAVGQRYGAHYMQKMLTKYDGDLEAALIAYNVGPGRADTFLKEGRNYAGLPAETQNYVAKVRENLTKAGVSEDQYLRNQMHERVAAKEDTAFKNGNGMDYYRDTFGLSMPDVNREGGWRELGAQAAAGTAYYGRDEDAQPLNAQQLADLGQQIKGGDASSTLAVMRGLKEMEDGGLGMGRAAAKQLGLTDPTFEYAARISMDGYESVANGIVRGRKMIDASGDKSPIGEPKELTNEFTRALGKSLMFLPQKEQQMMKDAIFAHFLDGFITYGPGVPGQDWDSTAQQFFDKSVNAVLSGREGVVKIGLVNDDQTYLPPGISAEDTELTIDNMTKLDYQMNSVDINGKPTSDIPMQYSGPAATQVPPGDISAKGNLRFIKSEPGTTPYNIYYVQMDDGNILHTGEAMPGGGMKPYMLKFDTELAQRVLNRPRVVPDKGIIPEVGLGAPEQELPVGPGGYAAEPPVSDQPPSPTPPPAIDVQGGGTPY